MASNPWQVLPTRDHVRYTFWRIMTLDRVWFAAGVMVLGWALALVLQGTYSVWLAATVFLGAMVIDEIRSMPLVAREARMIDLGEIQIREKTVHIVILLGVTFVVALRADPRLMFSVLPLGLLIGLYMAQLLPERSAYHRLRDVPAVNDLMLAFTASFFVLSSILFFNQVQSGAGILVLIVVVTIRFFIGFTIGDIGGEQDRDSIFTMERPPATVPERFGSWATKQLLLVVNAASFILFGSMLAFQLLHPLAAFPLLTYLFSFVFIFFTDAENSDTMAQYFVGIDTYIFFLFTVIGWASFQFGAVA